MDDLARFNRDRWNGLVRAGIEYSLPMLDLDATTARHMLDPDGVMEDVAGLNVLCLAAGGGQQSVAFALLAARVTVFDLSDAQLEQDRLAAQHYGIPLTTVQGDMRDLSAFDDDTFDFVYQAYSINFVPDVRPVHSEVARVLRAGGLYRLQWYNPFTQTVDENSWNGKGYLLSEPYVDSRDMIEVFGPDWDVTDQKGAPQKIPGPREFLHAFSTMINSLAAHGFTIVHASEDTGSDPEANPGTWSHFMQVTVPYLTLWAKRQPKTLAPAQHSKG